DFTHFKDPGFHYEVALAQTAGLAVLRIANADVLPFDFTYLYHTIDGYVNELQNLLERSRKNTALENQLIRSHYYKIGEDPLKNLETPALQDEVPFLDFSPLQNALQNLKTSADSIQKVFAEKVQTGSAEESFNQSLYRAEQQLLSETGLPRRPWYKHTIYAPGFYTGYGVKTMPGIREAIEQRHWDEAQQQIKISANAIERLADYLNNLAK
ncbi:MAG: transferrin receptor-like dimerization domain-containing protein, partial [Flavisolibacter sp.]